MWYWIAGAFTVGYLAGVQKQRMKDDAEIIAAGSEGQAFATKLGSMRPQLVTKTDGLKSDARMFFALSEPLNRKA